MEVYEEIELKRIINGSGKMTALGASALDDEVVEYMGKASKEYVDMDSLIDRAGKIIAEYVEAEDACVTIGAAATIAMSVAGIITNGDISKIEKIPFIDEDKKEIIIQKGHCVNFGAPIVQMIALGGGVPVEVGQVNSVKAYHIEEAISEKTAALIYIKSHHCVQKGMVPLEDMIGIAKKHDIPIIVDAAAEEDLKRYIHLGADLVAYSGGKAICGPTSGFIAGSKELINSCKLQYKGIGRAMKVGKENIMGLLKAMDLYSQKDKKLIIEAQKKTMEGLEKEVNKLKGLKATITQDEAGREIYRLKILVDDRVLGVDANYIIDKFQNGNPSVYTRNHYSNIGIIYIDPRPLKAGDDEVILERLKEIISELE